MHILEEIREVAVSKNVNFLIGSGCSADAIGLMSQYWTKAKSRNKHKLPKESAGGAHCKDCEKLGNKLLLKEVSRISKIILKPSMGKGQTLNNIKTVSCSYEAFIREVINLMNRMNSRQNPRNINIFTTNYDLFIENALDEVSKTETFVINDGARGYFKRVLDSSNFNLTVSYRGPFNNFVDEIPSISLVKPHGSVNWEKTIDDEIEIKAEVVKNPVIVNPDGHESRATFEENYFHDMLRIFQTELDKPQSVLFVIGFSFQDKHIAKMMQRALRNKELNVYIFCYSNNTEDTIRKNLACDNKGIKNLKFILPQDIQSVGPMGKQESGLTLEVVTDILKSGAK